MAIEESIPEEALDGKSGSTSLPISAPCTTRRRLTVSAGWSSSRTGRCVRERPESPCPFLRLQGRWLARAGFAIGSAVHVDVAPGRLVIELIKDKP
jgi:hypothetical protein